ncbi:hypothetical protein ACI2LC_44675, partial [Nonomuraea wenchangensis]|uniref:hypothetical protein n=1 Tax=Nonomuraea wenchangensis TaxID=568860 RepID=UPI00384CB68E
MVGLPERLDPADDSLPAWTERYLDLAVRGVRSAEVTAKISRHLQRFAAWISGGLGHDRLAAVTPREVSAWRDHLAAAGTAAATARPRRNPRRPRHPRRGPAPLRGGTRPPTDPARP